MGRSVCSNGKYEKFGVKMQDDPVFSHQPTDTHWHCQEVKFRQQPMLGFGLYFKLRCKAELPEFRLSLSSGSCGIACWLQRRTGQF